MTTLQHPVYPCPTRRRLHHLPYHIQRKRIVEDKNLAEINKFSVRYIGDLKLAWKGGLREGYQMGRRHAKTEIRTERQNNAMLQWAIGIPPEKALQYFEKKAFEIAGASSDRMNKEIKQVLYNALKNGYSTAKTLYEMEAVFAAYDSEGKWLKTAIYTNFNDTYNQGRMGEYQESMVVEGLEYSAIMDDVTTDICRELDQSMYPKNDPIWNTITPPNHFNCRSFLAPVLTWEYDRADVSEPPKVMPAKGFA